MSTSPPQPKRQVAKNTVVVGLWTAVSRVFGAVRDLVVAHLFGATWTADAFYIAQTIPNAFRRLVGEGAVAAVLVPTYAGRLERADEATARRYARALLGIWIAVLAALIVVGILAAPLLVSLFAAGYRDNPEAFDLTVSLTRWMFPYLGLVSVVGFFGGVANSHGRFGASAASPVVFNVFIILGAIVPMSFVPDPIYGLAVGVVVGGLAQLALLSGDLIAGKIAIKPVWKPEDADLKEAWQLMLPQLFGIAIYQINIIVLRTYASFLPEGSVTQYYNASRLQELALGVFAVAIATASQPTFARLRAKGDRRALSELFQGAFNSVVVVNVGAATGLIALGLPICIVLFGHGKFSHEAVELTAWTLFWLALALIPVAIVRVVGQIFYAFKQAKRPVQAGFWSMVVNAISGAVFAYYFGIAGLGMGLALATSVQAYLLMRWMLPQLESWVPYALSRVAAKCVLAALIMGVPVGLIGAWFPYQRSGFEAAGMLGGIIALGGFIYLITATMFGVDELAGVAERIARRFRR
ncbi:MAG: murein biosynthesis integral membrane protein MurJ [Myxococcota bacterium]|nr:murein biosynthesis integral membrane protein MurJ [Myxococcota bacterium]